MATATTITTSTEPAMMRIFFFIIGISLQGKVPEK
jgi:hypothetical protein